LLKNPRFCLLYRVEKLQESNRLSLHPLYPLANGLIGQKQRSLPTSDASFFGEKLANMNLRAFLCKKVRTGVLWLIPFLSKNVRISAPLFCAKTRELDIAFFIVSKNSKDSTA